jgi:small subunit ribosomal protein S13
MARIAGVELPNKRLLVALRYIYGVGKSLAYSIPKKLGIDPNKKISELTEEELAKLKNEIEKNYKVEGDLRTEIRLNIKRLIEIGCYRGIRHKKGLPVRGQRTKTNARTRKGPRAHKIGKKKSS